jgi:hypothetical protein
LLVLAALLLTAALAALLMLLVLLLATLTARATLALLSLSLSLSLLPTLFTHGVASCGWIGRCTWAPASSLGAESA